MCLVLLFFIVFILTMTLDRNNLMYNIFTEHIFSKINDMADVGITIHTFPNTNIQLCDVKFASLICVRKRAIQ